MNLLTITWAFTAHLYPIVSYCMHDNKLRVFN